ncbi:WD40/YVTN/BNR-like repeat-containing protein [Acidobacteriota bacterium]
MSRLKKWNVYLSLIILCVCILGVGNIYSQQEAFVKDLKWRNIGPANMSGRVTDIQALNEDYRHVIVASASGGVWKSLNAGTTWTPIFDTYGSASIGAVALFQKNPDIIWVGTGEANVRNSVGWGDGVYKSTDGGLTFINVGLKESHHIAKMAAHPTDPNILYVAAQGHLWGYTGDRGLFKTADGGKTWEKLGSGLPDDGKTGCTEIQMDPSNPDILYTAFWQRLRQPFRFDSGGPNGGIFQSKDAGKTWKKLTTGLPEGDLGRIGLSIYRENPLIVMAIVEHGFQPRANSEDYLDMKKLGTGIYRSEDGGESWTYVNRYNIRPFYYSQIYVNPIDDLRAYVMGTNAQVSFDGGHSFSTGMPGIAGDFHVMWLDPNDSDRYYVGNDKGVSLTHDHGEHYNFFNNYCIAQIYAVSADLRDPYTVYVGLQDNGIWGGPSNSRDFNGIFNDHWFKFHSGDGFYTAVDPTDWTTVYSESQGGRLRRNHALFRQTSVSITPSRTNTVNWAMIPKQEDPNRPVLRMNWNTPFQISHFNPHTLYYGANFLFKSVNRGENWTIISPDLSTNHPEKSHRESGGLTRDVTSAETHCTIVTLSESPLQAGVIWVGTDDGNVQITRTDGRSWKNIRPNIQDVPEGMWVSCVEASHFKTERCYVTFDGHRSDIFSPFVFKTEDFGETWENITNNLPEGQSTYVIREDLKNEKLLFMGTEFAVFVSLNGGESWTSLMNGMPTVAVHDLLIHPTAGDLIAGTHGRGVWICDDITPLQQLTDENLKKEVLLLNNPVTTMWKGISRGATMGHQLFIGQNPLSMSQVPPSNSPSEIRNTATINYYLQTQLADNPVLEIVSLDGSAKRIVYLEKTPGIHRYRWDLRFEPAEQRKKLLFARMGKVFEDLKGKVDREQKKRLNQLYEEFQLNQTPDVYNRTRQLLMEEFRMYGSGRQSFGILLEGPPAGAGTYILTLKTNGHTQKGVLVVREDPLFGSLK